VYAFLIARFPAALVNTVIVLVQAAAIVLVVLLADKPFGEFAYMRL